ncbi:MAG TPA: hypothetical protein ENK66_08875 [Arcobacter sp.]|nr:hypothetical protein [Arcobacter sp.]
MFIRVTKSKNHQYVKVVENYREDGKVKQKVIANLGKLEEISVKEAENIASKLLLLAQSQKAVVKEETLPNIEEDNALKNLDKFLLKVISTSCRT